MKADAELGMEQKFCKTQKQNQERNVRWENERLFR